MRRIFIGVAVLMVMMSPNLMADTLRVAGSPWLTDWSAYFGTPFYAGEIRVEDITPTTSLPLNDYSSGNQTRNGDTFQTFCLEANEDVVDNTDYSFVQANQAVNGGVGGGSPDPLSKGTAFLYSKFADGTLNSSQYDYTGANRYAAAAAMQWAIWVLEEEVGGTAISNFNSFPSNGPSAAAQGFLNGLRALLIQQFDTTNTNNLGVALANAMGNNCDSAGNCLYGAKVLNLTSSAGLAQDVLYATSSNGTFSTPDGAETLVLLGIALSSLGLVSRRFGTRNSES